MDRVWVGQARTHTVGRSWSVAEREHLVTHRNVQQAAHGVLDC